MTDIASDINETNVGGATVKIQPNMADATAPATASQTVRVGSANERTITDELGRTIKLKRPNVVSEFRFIEMLGDSSSNQVFFSMTMPLLWVVSFDGSPVAKPSTKPELYALMGRLGDEGVAAVLADAAEQMNAAVSHGEQAKNA